MCNEKKAVDLSYQQKPNDKGSADGELMISVDPKAFERDESEESGDAVSEDFQPYFESGSYSLSIKFNGEKKDNKVSVNTKLEISTDQSGLKITATINIAFLYEKVSDTENKFSVNISTNVMDTVVDLTFSGGKKIVDYTAIKVPADSEVDDISKVNSDDLIKKLTEKYPGIEKYTPSFKFSSQSTKYEETEFEVYNTEDSSFSIILYKNGRGYLSSELKDLKYENGKYSVKLPDESTISGTYTQNGNNFTIDGKTGFVMESEDGCKTISKTVNDEHVSINIDSANNEIRIDSNFTYTLNGETLKLELATGGEKILKFVKNGDSCTINGVKVKLEK